VGVPLCRRTAEPKRKLGVKIMVLFFSFFFFLFFFFSFFFPAAMQEHGLIHIAVQKNCHIYPRRYVRRSVLPSVLPHALGNCRRCDGSGNVVHIRIVRNTLPYSNMYIIGTYVERPVPDIPQEARI